MIRVGNAFSELRQIELTAKSSQEKPTEIDEDSPAGPYWLSKILCNRVNLVVFPVLQRVKFRLQVF